MCAKFHQNRSISDGDITIVRCTRQDQWDYVIPGSTKKITKPGHFRQKKLKLTIYLISIHTTIGGLRPINAMMCQSLIWCIICKQYTIVGCVAPPPPKKIPKSCIFVFQMTVKISSLPPKTSSDPHSPNSGTAWLRACSAHTKKNYTFMLTRGHQSLLHLGYQPRIRVSRSWAFGCLRIWTQPFYSPSLCTPCQK